MFLRSSLIIFFFPFLSSYALKPNLCILFIHYSITQFPLYVNSSFEKNLLLRNIRQKRQKSRRLLKYFLVKAKKPDFCSPSPICHFKFSSNQIPPSAYTANKGAKKSLHSAPSIFFITEGGLKSWVAYVSYSRTTSASGS